MDSSNDYESPDTSNNNTANVSNSATYEIYEKYLMRICIVIFLHVCAIGIIVPIFGDLVLHLFDDNSSAAGLFLASMSAVQSLLGFFSNLYFGSVSDHYGRRPFMLMAISAVIIECLLLAFYSSIALFVLAVVFYGTLGVATSMLYAMLVDISPRFTDLPKSFGWTGGAFGMGLLLGVGVGAGVGALTDNDLKAPFLTAAIFQSVVTLPYSWKWLPETLSDKNRILTQFTLQEFFERLKEIRSNLKILTTTPRLKMLTGVAVCTTSAASVVSVFLVYSEERYDWKSSENGSFLFCFALAVIVAQVLLVRSMVRSWGEDRSLRYCLYILTVAFVLWGLATSGWMMYVVLVLATPGLALSVMLSSELSKEVVSELQGKLQGAMMALRTVSDVGGSILMGAVFSYSVSDSAIVYLPGAPFYLSAVFMGAAIVFHVFASQHTAKSDTNATVDVEMDSLAIDKEVDEQ